MAHFRGALSLSIKVRPGAQPLLICMWMKSFFHMKELALRLALRKRLKVIQSEIHLLLFYFTVRIAGNDREYL